MPELNALATRIRALSAKRPLGRVRRVGGGLIEVGGLPAHTGIGARLTVQRSGLPPLGGEVLRAEPGLVEMLTDAPPDGVSVGDSVTLVPPPPFAPDESWIGRVLDPLGRPLDGRPLLSGGEPTTLDRPPPAAATRRGLGERLDTGLAAFNTFLPIVRGQRLGLFAGSGVGKSSLIAHLARRMEADVVVIALIGERGREVGHFTGEVLGEEGMRRAVVVAATSDQSPMLRRRCAAAAMTVAEFFRDQGKQVLFLADSVTRLAEAHREIAVAAGEPPSLRGYPPSTAGQITALCERAGTGTEKQGDITAIFSVLVAGSDMEEPVADMLRGVLDGHVVLAREIAERGRYPAIDLLQSVSRSLPAAATDAENALLNQARQLLGAYRQSEVMIKAGLYAAGGDPILDRAVRAYPDLDAFLAQTEQGGIAASFDRLALILRRAGKS